VRDFPEIASVAQYIGTAYRYVKNITSMFVAHPKVKMLTNLTLDKGG